jgi:hypothetical protein
MRVQKVGFIGLLRVKTRFGCIGTESGFRNSQSKLGVGLLGIVILSGVGSHVNDERRCWEMFSGTFIEGLVR